MKPSVFIFDDEPEMIKAASRVLEQNGYTVASATNPEKGLMAIRENPPHLILLDISMPEMDGLEVCKAIRADSKLYRIPVIMLSIKSDETDVVVGLEVGADDYIPKPFRSHELLARVKAVMRRHEVEAITKPDVRGPIEINHKAHAALLNGKDLKLTPTEFDLLVYFLKREGRVVTRGSIGENIWGVDFKGTSRSIDYHVFQLRKKLGGCGGFIKSLHGIGFRFEVDDASI